MKTRPQPDLYVKPRVVTDTKDKPKRRPNSKKAANVEWYARELVDQHGPFICLGKQWWISGRFDLAAGGSGTVFPRCLFDSTA